MRIKVGLISSSISILPFNYNYHLMGLIYQLLASEAPHIAEYLHSMRSFKPFTFSNLWFKGQEAKKDGIHLKPGVESWLVVSSIITEMIQALANAFAKSNVIHVAESQFEVTYINVYEDPIFPSTKFIFISPVIISRPVDKNGKLYHEFLSPMDDEYAERFVMNLKKKYEFFTNKKAGEVRIIPDMEYVRRRRTSKLIRLKQTNVRAHAFPFELVGDIELIKFGYYVGFGERTGQGFGCAEVVKNDRKNL